MSPPDPVEGWLAPEVREELPGLRLMQCDVSVGRRQPLTGDATPDVQARLRELSNRVRGARGIGIRREPVPAAYRAFFRQIGLDPDLDRTPIERALVERMLHGGFLSAGLLEDVLTVSLVDTGVPVWALDGERVEGALGVRTTGQGERLGRLGDPQELPAGRLVIADSLSPLAILFGELAPAHGAEARTGLLRLFSIQVAGVPDLYADEALWSCANALQEHW